MGLIKYYDTSSLLNCNEEIFNNDSEVYLSYKTIDEIESIKTSVNKDQDLKYKARNTYRLLNNNIGKYTVIMEDVCKSKCIEQGFDVTIPDNQILAGCLSLLSLPTITNDFIEFYTEDVLLKIKADAYGLNVQSVCNDNQEIYTGYKIEMLDDIKLAYFYEHLEDNQFDSLINQYLILKNKSGDIVDKLKWNGNKHSPVSYKQISNDFTGKIKPRNIEQELTFDLLQDNNTTIKVLSGVFGSGKDYLMASTALHFIKSQKFKKIVWIRNNVEVKNTKPIGYLPNGKKDKLLPFAMPLADHLGDVDGLELYINSGKIDIEHLGFIRGRDIKDSIIICSEAENMTKEHIQLLISRVGEGSNLWINGDLKQVDSDIFKTNNGLSNIIDSLKGNPLFGFVKLNKTERSATAQLADLLD